MPFKSLDNPDSAARRRAGRGVYRYGT